MDAFIITRYNVPSSFAPRKDIHLDDDWLDHRFDLFATYCLPSIENQSDQNFSWLIIMDETTRASQRQRVEEITRPLPNVTLVLTATGAPGQWENDVRHEILQRTGSNRVATSRLDNDDALHTDYIRLIRGYASGLGNESFPAASFLTFAGGYSYRPATGILMKKTYENNPFATKFERRSPGLTTVFCGNHGHLRDLGPFMSLHAIRAWIQVIHDRNVSNGEGEEPVPGTEAKRILRNDFGIVT